MTIDLKIRTALELAVAEALEKVGKTAFKRTSMFMSSVNRNPMTIRDACEARPTA